MTETYNFVKLEIRVAGPLLRPFVKLGEESRMSHTTVFAPIVGAIVGSEDILGPDRRWVPTNAEQLQFKTEIMKMRDELPRFSKEELRHWANKNHEVLNAISRKEGFSIQLKPFGPDEFGVISILDVLVEWLIKGSAGTKILRGGKEYAAVSMDRTGTVGGQYHELFEVYVSENHTEPVVMLATKSGDRVFMTVAYTPAEGFVLSGRIDNIRKGLQKTSGYEALRFPMVDLNQQVDISWLIYMNTTDAQGRPWFISQALQQTKFKMNEVGARVKSEVAIGLMRYAAPRAPRTLIIDRPFYLWMERDGVTIPIMYSYIDEQDWKNPGSLEM